MASVINTNNASLVAQRNLSSSQTNLTTSVQRLSSGLRINSAKDDAAGLGISQKLQSQITGANVAARNANDAISMVSTAEGGMQEVSGMLQRMRELATQGNNDSLSDVQRGYIGDEITALQAEVNKVSTRTTFNGHALLNGSLGGTVDTSSASAMQVGTAGATGKSVTTDITISSGATAQAYTFASAANATTATSSDITLTGADGSTQTLVLSLAEAATGSATLNFDDLGISITLATDRTATDVDGDIAGDLAANTLTLSSSGSSSANFQVGTANSDTVELGSLFQDVSISSTSGDSDLLALAAGISAATLSQDSADFGTLTTLIDTAIDTIAGFRSDLGSMSNRLDYNIANLQNQSENLSASMSRVMDTDYAAETAQLSKNQVMSQAATAMLSQANQMPNAVLSLLK